MGDNPSIAETTQELQQVANSVTHRAMTNLQFSSSLIDCCLWVFQYCSFQFSVVLRPSVKTGWSDLNPSDLTCHFQTSCFIHTSAPNPQPPAPPLSIVPLHSALNTWELFFSRAYPQGRSYLDLDC